MGTLLNWAIAVVLGTGALLLMLALGVPLVGIGGTAVVVLAFFWSDIVPGRKERRKTRHQGSVLFQRTENDDEWRG